MGPTTRKSDKKNSISHYFSVACTNRFIRIKNANDKKLVPETKCDKLNTTTSKNIDSGVMTVFFDVIFKFEIFTGLVQCSKFNGLCLKKMKKELKNLTHRLFIIVLSLSAHFTEQ